MPNVYLYKIHFKSWLIMNYRIEELDSFIVIGQAIQLTTSQKKNIELSKRFWKQFNWEIKKAHLSQGSQWIKYAFMMRRNNQLYYYCALEKQEKVPDHFFSQQIIKQKYLVFEHIGHMDNIYNTYNYIYQQFIPFHPYTLNKNHFLHFEKYDYRFHWNKADSVIEIWIPIEEIQ